jgi:hypothetical protein
MISCCPFRSTRVPAATMKAMRRQFERWATPEDAALELARRYMRAR